MYNHLVQLTKNRKLRCALIPKCTFLNYADALPLTPGITRRAHIASATTSRG